MSNSKFSFPVVFQFDLSHFSAIQDMIRLAGCSYQLEGFEKIFDSLFNIDYCNRILSEGWYNIALSLWGHAEPERRWRSLKDKTIRLELSQDDFLHFSYVTLQLGGYAEEIFGYFVLCRMEDLGFHI